MIDNNIDAQRKTIGKKLKRVPEIKIKLSDKKKTN